MTEPSRPADFFTAGGTLRPDSPSYVKRPADDALFGLALAAQFCYVLTARQLGKSSLMVRTAKQLQKHGASTAIIDLTDIGTVTVDQWYLGLITRLKRQLNLTADADTWWAERASLGPVQRFTDFLRDVILGETEGPVVIFIDEIDSTLNLDFSDDFFAAIRAMYNARASDPELSRLTFVLLGVATPTDLIKDRTRTPFNIGQGVTLQEFSRTDAQILENGVEAVYPGQGKAIFDRIFHWTNGHPYLTQKLCLEVAERGDGTWTDERVDRLVEELFLSEEARRDTNLQLVQDRIEVSPQRRRLLNLYRKVYEGREIADDERSPVQNRLKLFGLVRAERGLLQIRNEIYRRVFDLGWIKANTPVDWTRRIAVISTVLVLLLGGLFGYYTYRQRQQTAEARAQVFIDNFRGTTSADVRITSLAGLFELSGYEDRAGQLFYEEMTPEERLVLFAWADPQAVGAQLIVAVEGLYTELQDNDQDNQLLEAMAQSLREVDDPGAADLAMEIEQWLLGRDHHAKGEYQQAIEAYSKARSLNDANPGLYFDRGRSYAELGQYEEALADFNETVRLDDQRAPVVDEEIRSNGALYDALSANRDQYPELAAIVPTPTSTATWTPVPISADTPMPTDTPTKVLPSPTATTSPTPSPTGTPTLTPSPTSTDTPAPTPTPALEGKVAYVMQDGIYVMDADGSNRRRVYEGHVGTPKVIIGGRSADAPEGYVGMAPLSPDGSKIAFARNDGLWVMDVNGSGMQQILISGSFYIAWAPDSKQIVYEGGGGTSHIVKIPDGIPQHVGGMSETAWSPDGGWFAYHSRQGLVKRAVSGGPVFVLDPSAGWGVNPAWSPDGTKIAYMKDGDIFVINADGSGQIKLTDHPAGDWEPRWSPDGNKIVFTTERDGNREIYVMNPDGSNQMNLTNSAENEEHPSWAP